MNTEQERKWLVENFPDKLEDGNDIYQAYLIVTEDREVRIRRYQTSNRNVKQTLGIKKGKGEDREEYEIDIDLHQLFELEEAKEAHVEKTRYEIQSGDHVIEVDVYKSELEGLVTAEVEDPEGFEPPKWFGREVTENEGYKNKWLSVNGIPEDAFEKT